MASNYNFNLSPYYDDYDEDKNFHHILFKPGFAVQARELTQLQTILQNQIERFGKNIFKEGTLVLGGQFIVDTKIDHIKIIDNISLLTLPFSELIGQVVVGQTTGIRAYIYQVAYRNDWGYTNDVLMVRYLSSGTSVDTFLNNEQLLVEGTDIIFTTTPSDATGKGTVFSIEEGVIFSKGFFIKFNKQTLLLEPISQTPSCKIGFDSTSSVVTFLEDTSLLDPALGSYNYSAPGADRLKFVANLTKLNIDDETIINFYAILIVKDGIVVQENQKTEYSIINDELARRTFDESGDYVVRGFGIRTREHLDVANNEGYLTEANGGDSTLLAIGVEPGSAYVQGYKINKLVTEYIPTEKSMEYESVNSEIISARNGNYLIVNETVGLVKTDNAQIINLYNTAETRVANNITSTTTPTGTKIGEAKIKYFSYNTAGTYNMYLFDIKMTGNTTFSNTKSISTSTFFSDVVLTSGKAVLQESVQAPLLYKISSNYIRSIRGIGESIDTTFTFNRSYENITIDNSGIFNVSVTPASETHAYGSGGSLSSIEKSTIILSLNQGDTITLPGTVSCSDNFTVTGINTYFTRLNINDRLKFNGVSGYYRISSITSDNILILKKSTTSTFSGQTFTKEYFIGDIIDLNGKGYVSGTTRDVSVSSTTTLNFDLKETFSTSLDISISFNIKESTAKEISKTLNPSRFVKINVAALSTTTDPIKLGFSDVFKIKQIRKDTSVFTTITQGIDVTKYFTLDNGQRDDFYDIARIIPKMTLTTSDKLLVELDYFSPSFSQGVGYFSINSYNIDDTGVAVGSIFTHEIPVYTSSTTGYVYDLRNNLDFRPVKQITAVDATDISSASVNPSSSDIFYSKDLINGLRIPTPASQVIFDYSYYLARKDVVVCDTKGNLNIIKGIASKNPTTPNIPEGLMGLAKLFIPPYPSLSTTYSRVLGKTNEGVAIDKLTNTRFTMRDIGVLRQRIENLEYYNALSLLEKSTASMLILDENGLDRFKNGFFVDGFMDHSLGATDNPDYKIAIDKTEGIIRPFFEMDSIGYNVISGSTNLGNLASLSYTQQLLLEQSRVTTIRNIEQSVFRFIGNTKLTPDTDNWIDTTTVDKTIEFGNNLPTGTVLSTEWGAWNTYASGYRVYAQSGPWTGHTSNIYAGGEVHSDAVLYGTYSSYADAINAAWAIQSYSKFGAGTYGAYTNGVIQGFTDQVRSQTQSSVTYQKETEQLGNFITDVSIQTYIRPQNIDVFTQGLKTGTRYYCFFDGEDMTQYITPYTIVDGVKIYQTEGDIWRSDIYGELNGILRLPWTGKRFRTGQKEVVVTDNPTNSIDATSYAKSYFIASGLTVQKQNTILSTKTSISSAVTSSQTKEAIAAAGFMGPSCMAYSFYVDISKEETGTYLTSIDVFVESVHPTLGVWFEIREMDASGGITRTQVPYSEVWYKSNEITTTTDGTIPHNIKFNTPVYLLNNTQYAFIIHTEGLNPNTYFWISRLGETDIITNKPVTGRQLTGNIYTTNNNLNWDIVPDTDLKIRLYRAEFPLNTTTNIILGNKPYEFFYITTPYSRFDRYGEIILGSKYVTLANVVGANTIVIGDKFQGYSYTCNVVGKNISTYYTDGFDISLNDGISVLNSLGVSKNITANISSINFGEAVLDKSDYENDSIKLNNTNGKFFINAAIKGASSLITSKILNFNRLKYSTVTVKPSELSFIETSTVYGIKGRLATDYSIPSNYTTFPTDVIYNMDNEYVIQSRSDEVLNYSGANSSFMQVALTTNSSYTSPAIDISSFNTILVKNIVNSDITGETNASGGNLLNKYISKTVTLSDGQDAEDLMVMLTAYIPSSTSVKVWMKIRNVEDTETDFSLRPWIEMNKTSPDIISSISNTNDFVALMYEVPTIMKLGTNGEIGYTSTNGHTFIGFKQFSIKIGLLADNSNIVPKVGDLKVIALQL